MDRPLSREELETYIKETCKFFSKKTKHSGAPFEIIVVGGASIVLNYDFREKTTDTDADFTDSYEFKEAIREVAEKYSLSDNWLNKDFVKTESYSPEIRRCSQFFKNFYGIEVRTIKDEYLIAMKLKSFRLYKHDHSDVLGILMSCNDITLEKTRQAVKDLYGSEDVIDEDTWTLFGKFMECKDKDVLYNETVNEEKENASALALAREVYPDDVKSDNSAEFIRHFKSLLTNNTQEQE